VRPGGAQVSPALLPPSRKIRKIIPQKFPSIFISSNFRDLSGFWHARPAPEETAFPQHWWKFCAVE
jgi:hypothetical protein